MKYVLLLFNPKENAPGDELEPWRTFGAEAAKRSRSVSGEPLQPAATAKVVSVREGKTITSDGPFVDTKEQIGGFYVLDCENMDVALELAAQVPWAKTGHIEVRPVMEW